MSGLSAPTCGRRGGIGGRGCRCSNEPSLFACQHSAMLQVTTSVWTMSDQLVTRLTMWLQYRWRCIYKKKHMNWSNTIFFGTTYRWIIDNTLAFFTSIFLLLDLVKWAQILQPYYHLLLQRPALTSVAEMAPTLQWRKTDEEHAIVSYGFMVRQEAKYTPTDASMDSFYN